VKLINLTPHALRIRVEESGEAIALESDIVIDPTAPAARVRQESVVVGHINDIPVKMSKFSDVKNLPEPQDGVVYIVSMLVSQRAHREDVVGPNTSPKEDIRYPEGHKLAGLTFAVRGFQIF
jgi:hypothetical protein